MTGTTPSTATRGHGSRQDAERAMCISVNPKAASARASVQATLGRETASSGSRPIVATIAASNVGATK